jgi:L-fuculose-phosphate aldolase
MQKPTVQLTDQVREVVQTVLQVLQEPKAEESSPLVAANSFEADALRDEIIRTGRKLWERQYVDGNGGNISVRLGTEYVLCTPTMVSKGDLTAADICLSDLDGNILAGDRSRTSELLLHLAIYKANPRARAVLHCHPPYATAFAITGTTPPNGLTSECEIFIGPAAMAPYETPGTQAFADTVLPFVEHHNTILLRNHGIVCWADTVTHAEWLVEIYDTYCKTCLLARQVGEPLGTIPEDKIREILALKRRLGFPDIRLASLPESELPTPVSADLERVIEQVVARMQDRA